MGRRLLGFGANLAILLTLAACGDGGSSGPITVTPTPSPSPSPTPSPTPTPTPTNTDLINLKADQTFQSWLTVYAYEWGGTTSAPNIRADLPPAHDNVLSYVVANQGYKYNFKDSFITAGTTVPAFDSSNRNAASNNAYSIYKLIMGSGMTPYNYRLLLVNAGASNPKVQLTYATAGSILLRKETLSTFSYYDQRFFAYGFPTDSGTLPTTGTFTYRGIVLGIGVSSQPSVPIVSRQVSVTGNFDATVDFAGRVLSGTVTLLEQTDPDNNPDTTVPLGTAPLSAGVFTALPDLTGKVASGSLGGFVAGPGAAEIGLTMSLDLPDPRNGNVPMHIVASAAGKK